MSTPHEASPLLPLGTAVSLLPSSDRIHTWKNDGLGVWPAYLKRDEVIGLMHQFGVRRAKQGAEHLGHGLLVELPGVLLFIQTRSER